MYNLNRLSNIKYVNIAVNMVVAETIRQHSKVDCDCLLKSNNDE